MSLLDFIRRKTYNVIFPTWDSLDVDRFGTKKSARDFLRYNEISLYTNRAIDKRAEKVSEVEFVLRRGEKEIERHPLLDLLNRPNRHHTGRQFWKLYQKYLDVTGSAYIWLVRNTELWADAKIGEMHLLRPDLMKVLYDSQKEIAGYEFYRPGADPITFKPEDIIYSFNPDPLDPLCGESILRSGVRAIDLENQLADYQSKVLRNGGQIPGVFNFKTTLNKEQITALKEGYKEEYAGAKNAGMPLFLGGDAKYERTSLSPDELSYLESKGATLDDICLMTGVPRSVLARTSDETFANADASIAIFLRETIKPLLENLTTLLDWRLIPDDLDLTFVDPTPEDVDRKIKLLTAANAVNALTTNEKREMLGQDPYPDKAADEILIPFSVMPLGAEKAAPAAEKPEDEEKGQKGIRKGLEHPLRDPMIRKRYGEIMVKRMDRREAELRQAMTRYFDDQEARLISRIDGVKSFKRKDLFGEAFDEQLEVRLAKTAVLPLIQRFLEEAGVDALALLGSDYTFVLAAEIRSWIDNRADVFAGEITATTVKRLGAQFEESFTSGESRQQLIRRIEETYEGFTEERARTIARTEVHAATQKGTFEGYRQGGSPIKIWVTVGDNDVRDSHRIDGEERPINMPFSNGLQFPGDPAGDAADVVNCRCSV
ncbi:MAG: phage portal protein [Thalassobaculum sp.]|uniref:phage portal protein n=1 Tax=Thalassobaculum sp. TaxID=2022740 RepID=UPI0032EEE5EB